MGGISTSVGLFSGIDTASLIDQLIAVEAQPRVSIERRIVTLQQQQASYLAVNSALLQLESAAGAFNLNRTFDTKSSTSSNTDVLTASASTRATEGTFQFRVHRLVSTQQQLSRGFADRDESAFGATEFTIEVGGGGASSETKLAELRGGLGVERGAIQITDKAGANAEIDLSTAVSVQDVLDRINATGGVAVTARTDGDRIVLEDISGGGGTLVVADAFGSNAATSLGIAGVAGGGSTEIEGERLRYVSSSTALAALNDGLGVHIQDGANDLRITARDGTLLQIDLGEKRTEVLTEEWEGNAVGDPYVPPTDPPEDFVKPGTEFRVDRRRAATLGDVISAINDSATDRGIDLTASLNADGTGLVITDNTGGGGNLIVQSASNRSTAEDLGIATDPAFDSGDPAPTGVASSTIDGSRLIAGIDSVLTKNINGGSGLTATSMWFTDRAGNGYAFDVSAASANGSLRDVVDEINSTLSAQGVGLVASLNDAGNGLSLTDTSGGTGSFSVLGAGAEALGIFTSGTGSDTLQGGNVQTRWIGLSTDLGELRQGRGIGEGTIRITDSTGGTQTLDIGSQETVADLLSFLNSRPGIGIEARINASGDGIEIVDTLDGGGDLQIEDVTGTVARNLNLAGTFTDDDTDGTISADGSYEKVVTFDPTDTLEDAVTKINDAGGGVSATIVNDGGAANSFRLQITSRFSGSAGRAIVDTKGFDLGMQELSRGDDAIVFFGSDDPAKAVLLTNSTNTLDGVIQGVSIDLKSASTETVEVSVSRDTESIETAIGDFVEAYNAAMNTIDQVTFFDSESNQRAALFGDTTTNNVRQTLIRTVQGEAIGLTGEYTRLFQVGVRLGEGSRLEFDSDRFRLALDDDFEGVRDLFQARDQLPREPVELSPGVTTPNLGDDEFSKLGFGEFIEQVMESLTNSIDGVLTQRNRTIDDQIEAQQDRIEFIDVQLERKRAVLEREFVAMEQAIASIQSQQAAINSIG